jgi:ABC-2 type transport system permease protein
MSAAAAPVPGRASQSRAFRAVLGRDVFVTWSELPVFLAQVILQPLFLLLVFGKVLASLGYTQHGYAHLLFPGLLALTAVITGMQTLAFPLVIEFGWTKEIEDRLLAPMATGLVAAEKIVFASVRAMIAAAIMIPVGVVVLGSVPWRWSGFPLLVLALILGSLLGSALGLALGTLVTPARINIVFSLVFTPLLFTGCSQYPWPSLSRLPWFKVVTACNPMTYVSELMRAALVPTVPHIAPWICVTVLIGSIGALMAIGVRGFYRRAID